MSFIKKKGKLIITLIIVIIAVLFFSKEIVCYAYYYNVESISDSELDSLNLDNVNNLMIVAHPDDETIWGGAHLIEGEYLVVCMTNARNSNRSNEFYKAVEYSNDKALIRAYPDKVFGKRDDWSNVNDEMKDDLKKLLNYKKWDTIVTHNPKGEYGHQHHIMLNEYVTEIYNELDIKDSTKLMYFGKYYTKKQLKKLGDKTDDWEQISDNTYEKKVDGMINVYQTQEFIKDRFNHMFPYENFVEYGKESKKIFR